MKIAARTFVALSLAALTLLAAAPVAPAHESCRGARALPTPANLQQIEHSTLCLINARRRAYRLERLRADPLLRLAAVQHSREMVANRYFGHPSYDGSAFIVRIRRTGYFSPSRAWRAGENIAWGSGSLSTPAAIVRGWMNSPPHRHNILTPSFREIGVGVTTGNPRRGSEGATYTTDFGYRKR